jgi:hypothetical protein
VRNCRALEYVDKRMDWGEGQKIIMIGRREKLLNLVNSMMCVNIYVGH